MFQTVGGGCRQVTWESCDNKKNAINVEHISRAATLLTGHCAGVKYNLENQISRDEKHLGDKSAKLV